jgi:hypothetical protein
MLQQRRTSRARSVIALVLVGLLTAAMAALAPPASAAIVLGAAINFPPTLTVGDTGVPVSIELRNSNTAPNASDINTVCEPGDPSPCRGSDINLVPSCWVDANSSCDTGGYEPGVFQPSSTAVGQAGTACAGMLLDVAVTSPIVGGFRFTPRSGAHITLPGAGSVCRIGFTVDVLRMPTRDQAPATAGIQTTQMLNHAQTNGAFLKNTPQFRSLVTVQPATPTIATTASPDITLGSGQLTDTASVSGRVNPQAGATVDFNLYGPGDATCTGTPVFTSTVPYPTASGPITSGAFTPTAAGTYRWVATYSGDTNNTGVMGACNDADEDVEVNEMVAPTAVASRTTAGLNPARTVVRSTRTRVNITVRSGGNPVTGGNADVSVDGVLRGMVRVVDGRATLRLPVFNKIGRRAILVEYSGVPGATQASSTRFPLHVVRARPRLRVSISPTNIHRVRTRPFLWISVTVPGQTARADVTIRAKGHSYARVHLVRGKGHVRLPRYFKRGIKSVQAKYLGSRIASPVYSRVTFRVIRRR